MPQVVDKSRYAAGDNSLEREIQVLCKVRALLARQAGVCTCSAGADRTDALARPGGMRLGVAAAGWVGCGGAGREGDSAQLGTLAVEGLRPQ